MRRRIVDPCSGIQGEETNLSLREIDERLLRKFSRIQGAFFHECDAGHQVFGAHFSHDNLLRFAVKEEGSHRLHNANQGPLKFTLLFTYIFQYDSTFYSKSKLNNIFSLNYRVLSL